MAPEALRRTLYYRFHRLLPLVEQPAVRKFARVALAAATLLWFAFVLAVLVLRYAILPNIEHYRPDIERRVSAALGLSVSIGRIEASWDGVNPDLALLDVRVADAGGRPALAFSRVQTVLSWWTVPTARLQLALLAIDQPTLHLRRDEDGRILVAGIPLNDQSADTGAADWILEPGRIRIRDATLVWEDAQRGAPALLLEDVNFGLDNSGRRHRFALTALPPPELAAKVDLRGDFRGRDLERAEAWRGQLYAAIDYADLAVWQRWIDYPVALPQGRGALRAWADFADGRFQSVTADLAVRDLRLRLAKNLPELDLDRLQGRIGFALGERGFSLSGKQLTLATRSESATTAAPAIVVPATDFKLDWQPGDGDAVSGSATASRLDLAALAALAGYLPLDVRSRILLVDYAPQGVVSELKAAWRGDAQSMQAYSVTAQFAALGLSAQGYFPGFSGLSGSIDLDEKGGRVSLNARKTTLDLPSVFPEAGIALDTLEAQAKWTRRDGVLDAELVRAEFAGADAAGSAHGTYRYSGEGPGTIDLAAELSRADARAIWRFMPHAVNANARHWLRDALVAGSASDARLTLKGDLAHFPFVDPAQGEFLVTARAHDVTLDYAPGWPKITGIEGKLRFAGPGMTVEAERGAILGTSLSATRAVIPDFDAPVTMLKVNGQVSGPTAEFLKFIEQSPVAEKIDRFTEDMRASGDGRLDLALELPLELALMDQARVTGRFQFIDNEVLVDAALPPLRQVNGILDFSEASITVPAIDGVLSGGPVQIKGGSQADGQVLITASGSLAVAQVRKSFDLPLFDQLSGAINYRGEVRVKKRSSEIVVDSTLAGLSSSLPEPFNKSARDALPLRFEKSSLPPGGAREARDQLRLTLGAAPGVLAAQILRRRQGSEYVVERGAVAVGRPLQLPERGLAVNVTMRKFDADFWRRALAAGKSGNGGSGGTGAARSQVAGSASALSVFSLSTPELRLLGERFNDAEIAANAVGAQWQIQLASRQASGELQWDGAGSGRLRARLQRLALEAPAEGADASVPEAVEELPALDVVAEDFSVGTRRFGRLELAARNEGRVWRLDRIRLANPAGSLVGSGQWQFAGGNRTRLEFKLSAGDLGRLLERLGFPGTLRGGSAQLDGMVRWIGPPSSIDHATLAGEMNVEATRGQFLKLDPGAGKLIGLISLQSLPRRVTLDFRDVFSEGFAFDSIAGKLTMQAGVMHSERLRIDGPAAHVVLRGDVDLAQETQHLRVNVQPELGGTAALGVALVNPVAGVATLLAHRILQNPLNQMFGFDYLVTGSWDDPKVERLGRSAAPSMPFPPAGTTSPAAEVPVSPAHEVKPEATHEPESRRQPVPGEPADPVAD